MNSRLISFGVAVMTITIIAAGVAIYDSSMDTVMDSMSKQEVLAFNDEFMIFEGEQTGSNIKSMLGKLISNANEYKYDQNRVPKIKFDKVYINDEAEVLEAEVTEDSEIEDYIDSLNKIRNKVESKHRYWVNFTYQADGLIDEIYVNYEPKEQSDVSFEEFDGNTIFY